MTGSTRLVPRMVAFTSRFATAKSLGKRTLPLEHAFTSRRWWRCHVSGQSTTPPLMDFELAQSPTQLKVLPHRQYITTDNLSPHTVAHNPLDQFRAWFKQAVESDHVLEPEAVSLATATPNAIPSVRMVLFKQLDTRGFVFFTNYTSRKSQELLANPHAALSFYWREVHRSIRVVGKVEKVSEQESSEYFHSRPLGSKLGAWASRQSTVVGEDDVRDRLHKVEQRFGVQSGDPYDVPLPDFWGGWRVIPQSVSPSFLRSLFSSCHQGDRVLERETLSAA